MVGPLVVTVDAPNALQEVVPAPDGRLVLRGRRGARGGGVSLWWECVLSPPAPCRVAPIAGLGTRHKNGHSVRCVVQPRQTRRAIPTHSVPSAVGSPRRPAAPRRNMLPPPRALRGSWPRAPRAGLVPIAGLGTRHKNGHSLRRHTKTSRVSHGSSHLARPVCGRRRAEPEPRSENAAGGSGV